MALIRCNRCGAQREMPEGRSVMFCGTCGNKLMLPGVESAPKKTFPCKKCGSLRDVVEGRQVQFCGKCGNQMTMPDTSNGELLRRCQEADGLRSRGEFDQAMELYSKINQDYPWEAEVFWGMVLCRFGIRYEASAATGMRIPVCHRPIKSSVQEDMDYQSALNTAVPAAEKIYHQEGAQLEEARKTALRKLAAQAPATSAVPVQPVAAKAETEDIHSIRCRRCGSERPMIPGRRVMFCGSCGCQITLPDTGDEKLLSMYRQADTLRRAGQFDQARAMYGKITETNPWEAEVYWGMMLCTYGIRYERSKMTGIYLPVCTREGDTGILDNPDYQSAINCAAPEAEKVYLQEGSEILEARRTAQKTQAWEEPSAPAPEPVPALPSFRCRKCGVERTAVSDRRTQFCGSCGSQITLPDLADGELMKLYRQAEELRFAGKYEQAEAVYTQITQTYSWEAEGYWGLLLCKYGVVYKTDRVTGTKVPECQRVRVGAVARDPNYKLVLDCASPAASQLYQKEAADIEQARKEALSKEADNTPTVRCDQCGCERPVVPGVSVMFCGSCGNRIVLKEEPPVPPVQEQELPTQTDAAVTAEEAAPEDMAAKKEAVKALIAVLKAAAEQPELGKEAPVETEPEPAREDLWSELLAILNSDEPEVAPVAAVTEEPEEEPEEVFGEDLEEDLEEDFEEDLEEEPEEEPEAVAQEPELSPEAILAAQKQQEARLRRELREKRDELSDIQGILSGKGGHLAGIAAGATAVAVGANTDGQCYVNGWTDMREVSAGNYHTLGLKYNGSVVATGQNDEGQCDVWQWRDIQAVSAGGFHSVGLKSDGTVVAVGKNTFGQCNVSEWRDIQAVCAGFAFTLGLKSDGTVVATGKNDRGQCKVTGWKDIVAVSAGTVHCVGLRSDGTVVATGDNNYDKCDVAQWDQIVAVCAGGRHTLGLRLDGTVLVTGNSVQTQQSGVDMWQDVLAVCAGDAFSVALKQDGTLVGVGKDSWLGANLRMYSLFKDVASARRERMDRGRKAADQKRSRRANLEKEKNSLLQEYAKVGGLFGGSRKSRIEARLAQIEAELQEV